MERKGTDSAAHGGSDLPEFANNMLAKLEALAAKAGYIENDNDLSSTVSPRGRGGTSGLPLPLRGKEVSSMGGMTR